MKAPVQSIFFACTLLTLSRLYAEDIPLDFEHTNYVAGPGDMVTLRVDFGSPVPNGLDVYTLRLLYPEGIFDPSETTVSVVPGLDNDLFGEGPAERAKESDYAEISGAAPLGEPYLGTTFVEFVVLIEVNSPRGEFPLTLVLPQENSFVNGVRDVIDEDLILGSAILTIEVPSPEFGESPVVFDAGAGEVMLSFRGVPSRSYSLEVSEDLENWSELAIVTANSSGDILFTDTEAASHPRRFYRLVD